MTGFTYTPERPGASLVMYSSGYFGASVWQ